MTEAVAMDSPNGGSEKKSQKRDQNRVVDQEAEAYRRQGAENGCYPEAAQCDEDAAEWTPLITVHCERVLT